MCNVFKQLRWQQSKLIFLIFNGAFHHSQPPLLSATGSNMAAVGGLKRGGLGKLGNSDFRLIPVFYVNDQISGIFTYFTLLSL